jgi:formylglycine-generating enzyme required for sulfatase activity
MLCAWHVLLSCACQDLLGIRDGHPYPLACKEAVDCQDDERCVLGRCEPIECGRSGVKDCAGLTARTCGSDGRWIEDPCDVRCELGACKPVPSCENLATCAGSTSCCKSDLVQGGSFDMAYTYGQLNDSGRQIMHDAVERQVRTFALDRFEVTVGRFRRFVDGYGAERRPAPGAGAFPGLAASGWKAVWSEDPTMLPRQQPGLVEQLDFFGQDLDDPSQMNLPVRGVNWYVANAFCIWDGGRLPTESEWSYAANGGERERAYPWADADLGSAINPSRAVYGLDAPVDVGTKPDGAGLFEQQDLAGNVSEWVFDAYHERPEHGPCARADGDEAANEWACVQVDTVNGTERVLRGGAYKDAAPVLENVRRSAGPSARGAVTIGFRCARDIPQYSQAYELYP